MHLLYYLNNQIKTPFIFLFNILVLPIIILTILLLIHYLQYKMLFTYYVFMSISIYMCNIMIKYHYLVVLILYFILL